MSNAQLRLELLRRITEAHPTLPTDRREAMASEIEATQAYAHNGAAIFPVGGRLQMARASAIAPAVTARITAEHVSAASSSSSEEMAPIERARARLASMGIDLDSALAGDAEHGRQFYGIDPSDWPKGAA